MKGGQVTLKEPEYFSRFAKLQTEGADFFKLRGNKLLVEKMEVVERKTSGGIILASDSKQLRNNLAETESQVSLVMLVGAGTVDENGEIERSDIQVGNIIITPPHSTVWYSTFPAIDDPVNNRIGIVHASEVSFVYRDVEAFQKAHGLLNAK